MHGRGAERGALCGPKQRGGGRGGPDPLVASAADITNENYLHEAGLVAHASSGTIYTDGRGHAATNLGVHEHWNNSEEKFYSRNLGKEEGIEMVRIRRISFWTRLCCRRRKSRKSLRPLRVSMSPRGRMTARSCRSFPPCSSLARRTGWRWIFPDGAGSVK